MICTIIIVNANVRHKTNIYLFVLKVFGYARVQRVISQRNSVSMTIDICIEVDSFTLVLMEFRPCFSLYIDNICYDVNMQREKMYKEIWVPSSFQYFRIVDMNFEAVIPKQI